MIRQAAASIRRQGGALCSVPLEDVYSVMSGTFNVLVCLFCPAPLTDWPCVSIHGPLRHQLTSPNRG